MLSLKDEEVIKNLLAQQDSTHLKELLQEITSGIAARMESQYVLIDYKLDSIQKETSKTHVDLTKAVGDITNLQIKLTDHSANCVHVEKIDKVTMQIQNILSVRKFINRALVVFSILVGIAYTFFRVALTL